MWQNLNEKSGEDRISRFNRYEVFGARYVVVSDPKVLPKFLDSEKFTMDTHSAAVAGSLSKEAHTAIAPAFSTEGAK